MADKKIEEVERVSSVGGTEILPASVSSAAKTVTTAQIKDYVVAALKAVATAEGGDVDIDTDYVYLKKDGDIKTYLIADLAGDIVNRMFDDAAITPISGTTADPLTGEETFVVNQPTDEGDGQYRELSVEVFKDYLEDELENFSLDISGMTAHTTPATTDNMVVDVDGTNKKLTLDNLVTFILSILYAKGTGDTTFAYTDQYLCLRNTGTDSNPVWSFHRTDASTLLSYAAGDVSGPSTTTENKIPQWDATTKTLKDGLTLIETSVDAGTNETNSNITSSSTNTEVPTAKAVYEYGQNLVPSAVQCSSSTQASGKIPQWDTANTKTLKEGLSLVPSSGSSGSAITSASTDTEIPTAKAVYDKYAVKTAKVTDPSLLTGDYIPQWDGNYAATGTLKKGLKYETSTLPSTSSTDCVPSGYLVKTAVDTSRNTSLHYDGVAPTAGNVICWDANATAASQTVSELGVCTSVSSSSTNTELATGKAVNDKVTSSMTNFVSITGNTPTAGNIAVFKGLLTRELQEGPATTTLIAESSTASDDKLPTERAVRTAIEAAKVTNPVSTNSNAKTIGNVPQWSGTDNKLGDGLDVVGSITYGGTGQSDIPTAQAVHDLVSEVWNSKGNAVLEITSESELPSSGVYRFAVNSTNRCLYYRIRVGTSTSYTDYWYKVQGTLV